jgi:hypothetical protein
MLYDIFASKDQFSRDLLAERGMDPGAVARIPQGEAFDHLVQFTGESASSLQHLLYTTHNIGMVWNIIGTVGIVAAIGIFIYGRWTLAMVRKR